ncbi:MAG: OmpA family protein [Candidatus Gastranaerophilales bacterium]
MAMMKKRGGEEGHEENIFWVTMSDLMLGLSIVFMTLFVLAMTGFTQQKIEQKQVQIEKSKELMKELDEANIKAEVDSLTGDVKISDLELFELNSYTLSDNGKAYLDKLVPIYINNIFSSEKLTKNVENLVIQGHTDSQSNRSLKSADEQYMYNMQLSLQRANSVADYIFKTNFNKEYSDDLMKILVVEGKSFSEPILVDGVEDYDKSRRVEMRMNLKRYDLVDIFFKGGVEND